MRTTEEKKDMVIKVRVSERMYREIEERAKEERESISSEIRKILRKDLEK